MPAGNKAPPKRDLGGNHLCDSKILETKAGSDDIHYRIDATDLMKMDLVYGATMLLKSGRYLGKKTR